MSVTKMGVGDERWCSNCHAVGMGQYLADGDGEHLVCSRCSCPVAVEEDLRTFQRRVDATINSFRRRIVALEKRAGAADPQDSEPDDHSGLALAYTVAAMRHLGSHTQPTNEQSLALESLRFAYKLLIVGMPSSALWGDAP